MNNNSDTRAAVPAWVWAATAVALISILSAVLWASMAPKERLDVNDTALVPVEGQPLGAGPAPVIVNGPQARPAYPTRSAPRVTVTEVKPLPRQVAPDPDPEPGTASANPRPAPKAAAPRLNVRDMFPMERVGGSGPAEAARPTQPPAQREESFPAFGHDGRRWAFTGRYASAGQVELTPTDTGIGGRTVYSLSGPDGQTTALFVQSGSDPGRYAIYRPTG